MNINDFINNNNQRLFTACKRINFSLHKELYSELYLYLNDNWHKFQNLHNDEVIYLSIDFIKKQLVWSNTPLKRTINAPTYKHLIIEYSEWLPEIEYNDLSIEIFAEEGNEFTNEYLLDLHNDYNEAQIKIIVNTLLVCDKMDLKNKILFDLYIQKNLSLREIAEKLNISLTSTHKLIKAMICEIKKLIENGNNN